MNSVFLSNKLLVWIGLISYPLYLWHWPLLVFPNVIFDGNVSSALKVCMIFSAFILAWATFICVEKKMRLSINVLTKTLCLLLIGCALIIFGLYTKRSAGFPGRSFVNNFSQIGWNNDLRNSWCIKREGETSEFCQLSNDSSPTISLIGDSMSWQLYFGLAKETMGTPDTIFSYAQGGCSGFLGFSNRSDFSVCEMVSRKAIETALNDDSVHTVVFSSYYRQYSSEVTAIDIGLVNLKQRKFGSEAEFDSYVNDVFSRLIDLLLKKNKRVIFVMHNPTLNFDPRSCVSRPLGSPVKSSCSMPLTEYVNDSIGNKHRELINGILKKYPEVKMLELSKLLCNSIECQVIVNDELLYRDRMHLSVKGSELVSVPLYKLIKSLN